MIALVPGTMSGWDCLGIALLMLVLLIDRMANS
jgi:hypothetical protein